MKRNFLKLDRIFRFTKLKPEMFMSITVNEYGLSLMGKFNNDLAIILNKLVGKPTIDGNGHITFEKHNIRFILY